MRYRALVCALILSGTGAAASGAAQSVSGAAINQAAALYHQGRFDSALVCLESLKGGGPWKHRDSLSLFQYLGMSSARLGRDEVAADYFSTLLDLDSLFQFPRNEDVQVAQAFAKARERRAARLDAAASPEPRPPFQNSPRDSSGTAANPGMGAGPGGPPPGKISMIDSGALAGKASPETGNGGKIGLAKGALPFGAGWLAGHKVKQGLAFGLVQAGGVILSLYASQMQSQEQNDAFRLQDQDERATVQTWQWVQRVSLSTALGAYLFSLIAAAGD